MFTKLTRRALFGLLSLGLGIAAGAAAGCEVESGAAREDKLVVFAAASLRDAFSVIGDQFKRSHPGVTLVFNFAGTQALRVQLEHGAAADVFASADVQHMEQVVRAARVVEPAIFARNEPVVVVAAEASDVVRTFADLPSAARIVVGAPEVPIGRYTLQVLDRAAARLGSDFRARVEAHVVSRELNVRQVLTKVALGEAEAGIVYRTDALAAQGPVEVVAIPSDLNVSASYPIAVLTDAAHPKLARAFVDFVLSVDGQRALASVGFSPPVPSSP